jgi:hypothetical protein
MKDLNHKKVIKLVRKRHDVFIDKNRNPSRTHSAQELWKSSFSSSLA